MKVCIFLPFPQNVTGTKFEHIDSHSKSRNGHGNFLLKVCFDESMETLALDSDSFPAQQLSQYPAFHTHCGWSHIIPVLSETKYLVPSGTLVNFGFYESPILKQLFSYIKGSVFYY